MIMKARETSSIIRHYRECNGFTQIELAQMLDVTQNTISAWERNTRVPSDPKRKKLCEVFSITEPELFGADAAPQVNQHGILPVLSWKCANRFHDLTVLDETSEEYVSSTVSAPRAFSMRIESDDFEPEFRQGDSITVNPDISLYNDDFVILADAQSDSAILMRYKKYRDTCFLLPLNKTLSPLLLKLQDRYSIIGKVIERIKRY